MCPADSSKAGASQDSQLCKPSELEPGQVWEQRFNCSSKYSFNPLWILSSAVCSGRRGYSHTNVVWHWHHWDDGKQHKNSPWGFISIFAGHGSLALCIHGGHWINEWLMLTKTFQMGLFDRLRIKRAGLSFSKKNHKNSLWQCLFLLIIIM